MSDAASAFVLSDWNMAHSHILNLKEVDVQKAKVVQS